MKIQKDLINLLLEDFIDKTYYSSHQDNINRFIPEFFGNRLLEDKRYLGGVIGYYDGTKENKNDSEEVVLEDNMMNFLLKYFPDMSIRVFHDLDKLRVTEKISESQNYYGSEDFYERRTINLNDFSQTLMANGFLSDYIIEVNNKNDLIPFLPVIEKKSRANKP